MAASVSIWSDPSVDWTATPLCLLRSTWDYHERYAEFMAWLDRVAAVTVVRNDPAMVRWSAHKSYLRDLAERGVPVVPTRWLRQGESHTLDEVTSAVGWRDVVIKPARGAAASDVLLVRGLGSGRDAGQAHLDRLLAANDVLVQPYLQSVADQGERALVFFESRFSHAVRKKPFDTKLSIDAGSPRVDVSEEEIAVARAAIDAAPGKPLYARVDLLHDDTGRPRVNEVELIEPALYLSAHAPARVAFADAVERELAAIAS